jgi:hypothetical protein
MIEFVPATMAHGRVVLGRLRAQELKTIAKLQIDPVMVLEAELGPDAWTCLVQGEPAAMFGAASETILGGCRLWMLTTPLVERHAIPLLRWSKRYVELMSRTYSPVMGMVDPSNAVSKRWLEWIGFRETARGEFITMRYYANGD